MYRVLLYVHISLKTGRVKRKGKKRRIPKNKLKKEKNILPAGDLDQRNHYLGERPLDATARGLQVHEGFEAASPTAGSELPTQGALHSPVTH